MGGTNLSHIFVFSKLLFKTIFCVSFMVVEYPIIAVNNCEYLHFVQLYCNHKFEVATIWAQ